MKPEDRGEKAEGNVLICFALNEEAVPFRRMAGERSGVAILLTGIGRQNAEKSVREFLDQGACASGVTFSASRRKHSGATPGWPPGIVLTCGFAGGLNPQSKPGDVLFEVQSSMSKVRSQLLDAGAKPATFFCADRVAVTAAEKKELREQTGADAVDMESAAIHAVCAERGIPCATVRVISDTANEDLPLDFNLLTKPDRNLDYGKLILAIAKSPRKIGALIKLQGQTRFAAERLAEVLVQLL